MTTKQLSVYLRKKTKEYREVLGVTLPAISFYKLDADEPAIMQCKMNYPYLDIQLGFRDDLKDKPRKLIDRFLLHELCHVLTDPLYAKACSPFRSRQEVEDEREKLTDTISCIVMRLLCA